MRRVQRVVLVAATIGIVGIGVWAMSRTGSSSLKNDRAASISLQNLPRNSDPHALPEPTAPVNPWDALPKSLGNTQPGRGQTWLLVGSDARAGEPARADAMILVRTTKSLNHLLVVSIPRDMRVQIQGHGVTKLNHALAYGSVPLLCDTIARSMQVRIDHTCVVDFVGFRELVDALGGVDVVVDHAMRYVDRTDGTAIDLAAGPRHLTGQQALDYVRFRHDALADTGRMERQRALLSAIVHSRPPVSSWWSVSMALLRLPSHVRVDGDPWKAIVLVGQLARQRHIQVVTHLLSGENRVDPGDGLWYFYVDRQSVQSLHEDIVRFDRNG